MLGFKYKGFGLQTEFHARKLSNSMLMVPFPISTINDMV